MRMTDRSDWEGLTGEKWAVEWKRTDRSFTNLTARLLSDVRKESPRRVLDIGCGAGELSLAIAREHPGAQVTGIDVSGDLVAVARERAANTPNARFLVADAAGWDAGAHRPDFLVSRHGVMFFADPVAAFAHLASIAAPGARLLFSCFREPARNMWASELVDLLPPGRYTAPRPGLPGPFAFSDPMHVEAILNAAGWTELALDPADFAYVAGTGGDPVSDAVTYFMTIGPAAAAASELGPDERAAFVERLEHFLGQRRDGSIVALPASAWIVSARVP